MLCTQAQGAAHAMEGMFCSELHGGRMKRAGKMGRGIIWQGDSGDRGGVGGSGRR